MPLTTDKAIKSMIKYSNKRLWKNRKVLEGRLSNWKYQRDFGMIAWSLSHPFDPTSQMINILKLDGEVPAIVMSGETFNMSLFVSSNYLKGGQQNETISW